MIIRIISTIVLLALFIPALLLCSTQQWSFLIAVLIGICGWEFANLIGFNKTKIRIFFGIAYGVFCWILYYIFAAEISDIKLLLESKFIYNFYFSISIFWTIFIPLILKFNTLGKIKEQNINLFKVVGILLSLLVLLPTWFAMIVLREISVLTLILFMAIVWVADSFAYFGGKMFGKHKLTITISPRKTIEGAAVALLSLIIYALLLNYFGLLDNIFTTTENSDLYFLLGAIYLGIISIYGDLFESYLKRLSDIKDSSQILPGHGGMLDRIDSLTATLPISLFLLINFAKY